MNKPKITFIIDVLLFLSLATMAGLGLLLKFVLVPGKETVALYGKRGDLTLWGMDRHDWGAIHLYIALFFIVLFVAHILLYWPMIAGLYEKVLYNATLRSIMAPLLAVVALLLLCLPLLGKPDLKEVELAAITPASPPPAPVSGTLGSMPQGPQNALKEDVSKKTSSLKKPRSKKIVRTRSFRHRHRYGYPAYYGKCAKENPSYCKRGAYLVAVRDR